MKKLNVAVLGLRFGCQFAEMYKVHPDVGSVTLFDIDRSKAEHTAESIGGARIADSFEEILNDPEIDAVHLVTPIPLHADQTVKVLESGKHCACTVPMATSLEDIRRIVAAKRRSGKNFMMMETSLYTHRIFHVKKMIGSGELGKIQFLRGSHYQDMVNWPDYWMGLPPMWYSTHAIAPMVVLAGARISRVNCFGSGTMAEELVKNYGNPYPVESALLEFENGLKGEVTRALFETAKGYQEGLFVYGSKSSFDWGFCEYDKPYITTTIPPEGTRGGSVKIEQIDVANTRMLLPEELRCFTIKRKDPLNPECDPEIGGCAYHHGSQPHLVNEFVRSCVDGRKPWIDEILAANITAAGICAHESAMRNGEAVIVPKF